MCQKTANRPERIWFWKQGRARWQWLCKTTRRMKHRWKWYAGSDTACALWASYSQTEAWCFPTGQRRGGRTIVWAGIQVPQLNKGAESFPRSTTVLWHNRRVPVPPLAPPDSHPLCFPLTLVPRFPSADRQRANPVIQARRKRDRWWV